MPFCPRGGTETDEGARFCASCGMPSGSSAPGPGGEPQRPGCWKRQSTGAKVLMVIAALVVTGVIAGGCTAGGEPKQTAASTIASVAGDATTTTAQATTTTTEAATTTIEETTATTQPTATKFGGTLSFWDLEMTVDTPQPHEGELFSDETKDMYVALVTMKNVGQDERSYNTLYFECRDTESFSYEAVLVLQEVQDLGSGILGPGKMITGYAGFEIPKGRTLASITYEPIVLFLDVSATWER